MFKTLPTFDSQLSEEHLQFLGLFSKAVRHDILAMTTNAQSGHPGGSLGMADYLLLLYAYVVGQSGEPVIVSNGHVSPAVYAVLANMGYIDREDVVTGFRKIGKPYEGHVTRHVPGVWYGTGPLGAGAGAATGFALAEKLKKTNKKVYLTIGDGESEEGQVYEMMNVAAKYKLDNLIAFMDYNQVQLSDALSKVMPYHPKAFFEAAGWEVFEVDGHDYTAMWEVLGKAQGIVGKPVFILGHTIMGKGVDFMEKEGEAKKATWHGKTASAEQASEALKMLALTPEEETEMGVFIKNFATWVPEKKKNIEAAINVGEPKVYAADVLTDCRSAYGAALLDLATLNTSVVALTADLAESVKTNGVEKAFPERHIDVGVAEQEMVSCSGGLSLSGFVPFCSTFGAFMTSRAKDQARVNDINECNVKMVSTHCGLSVGEDGPTHQAIDDSGSMLGFFHTKQLEPADPNQCDRMIRFVAKEYGNVYVRMGRHKIPVLTRDDGSVFFDASYAYHYGQCDILREGSDMTIAAMGATVCEALRAYEELKKENVSVEIVVVSSIKQFDAPLFDSIKKTKRVLTVEDHNTRSGLGSQLARALATEGIAVQSYTTLGVEEYQLSGTSKDLYHAVGIDGEGIAKKVRQIL